MLSGGNLSAVAVWHVLLAHGAECVFRACGMQDGRGICVLESGRAAWERESSEVEGGRIAYHAMHIFQGIFLQFGHHAAFVRCFEREFDSERRGSLVAEPRIVILVPDKQAQAVSEICRPPVRFADQHPAYPFPLESGQHGQGCDRQGRMAAGTGYHQRFCQQDMPGNLPCTRFCHEGQIRDESVRQAQGLDKQVSSAASCRIVAGMFIKLAFCSGIVMISSRSCQSGRAACIGREPGNIRKTCGACASGWDLPDRSALPDACVPGLRACCKYVVVGSRACRFAPRTVHQSILYQKVSRLFRSLTALRMASAMMRMG